LCDALADLLAVQQVTIGRSGQVKLVGRLTQPAEKAYDLAARRLEPLGYTPLFRREGGDHCVLALPQVLRARPSRAWVNLLLFGLTLLSVLFIGAGMSWDPRQSPAANLLGGALFALPLLTILGAHELGHYFVGRLNGVALSLPYFIPLPLPPFGTMGAFIQLKLPPRDRRALLAMAVAGPLAGLAVGIPLLILGLKLSTVGPLPLPGQGGMLEGNSILYATIKRLLFGRFLPGGGVDVNLHPVAFAAWAGIFVTGLNLIPAGQLDGGHVAYVLIGERARYLSLAISAALLALGFFVWPGWYLWAAVIFFLGRTFATPLDAISGLDAKRVALAVAMLVIWALIFIPIPLVEL